MVVYAELELRYIRPVAHAIIEDTAFRRWLLADTKRGNAFLSAPPVNPEVQAALRSQNLKNPYWFNYFCGKSPCACSVGKAIETDILFILESADGRRLAVHIEVKRPDELLGDGQAETYPRRAACWASADTRPQTVPQHHDFLTILICGENLASDARVQYFDKVIFHDQIAQKIKAYPETSQ
jgi:hypothetical protein